MKNRIYAPRLLAWALIALLLLMSVPAGAFASERDFTVPTQQADALRQLGLFQGTDTGYELERAPTRIEALVMLIRLLGQEQAALAGDWSHPFTDVPEWAEAYAGYAWENGLTKGVSETLLDAAAPSAAAQYLTFVLRALGYSDAAGDFSWDNPYQLAVQADIFSDHLVVNDFLRADVVLTSYAALSAAFKDSEQLLAAKLVADGVFTAAQLTNAIGLVLLTPSVATEPKDESEEPTEEPTEEPAEEPAEEPSDSFAWVQYLSYKGIDSDAEMKEAWLDALPRMPQEIVFSVAANQADHYVDLLDPFSYLTLSWSVGFEANYGGDTVIVKPLYTQGVRAAAALELDGYPRGYPADDFIDELAAAAQKVYDRTIRPGMSEYEQAKAIHDYLVKNCEYDQTMAAASHDIEGVLLHGAAVCNGYANTFKLLMDMCGIDCIVVGGTGTNSKGTENHAWNKVCIDGDWYNVDVTWDDPIIIGNGRIPASYDYFLVSDAAFKKDHSWDTDNVPAAAKSWR